MSLLNPTSFVMLCRHDECPIVTNPKDACDLSYENYKIIAIVNGFTVTPVDTSFEYTIEYEKMEGRNSVKTVEVIPSIFTKPNANGDFVYMIDQSENANAMFVFCDNVNQHGSRQRGGGSAAIRPRFQRCVGIPTGIITCGFSSLEEGKSHIDSALEEIRSMIRNYGYTKLYFPSDGKILGHSIFAVPLKVREYITQELYKMEYMER